MKLVLPMSFETDYRRLSARGVDASLQAEIATFRAEARFLRAYSYYNLMDLFGNVPITTENDPVGFFTRNKNKGRGFAFVESELKEIRAWLLLELMNTVE
jgi:hypothetical protein